MVRNQARSSRGRSAIARRAILSGTGVGNDFMPQGHIVTFNNKRIGPKHYFGGMKKGGAAPSATGFMRPSNSGNHPSAPALVPNYLFKMTQYQSRAGGYSGMGGPML